jgi:hypothetical protein
VNTPVGAGLTYSINGSTYQSSTTFSNVAAGTYNLTVQNSSGCVSTATAVTVNAQPATPAAATATVTQPTCTVSTGVVNITAPLGNGLTYSIDGQVYQSSTAFSGVVSGTFNLLVQNVAGCISQPASITINPQPVTPAAPTVSVTDPTCTVTTGTITVVSPIGSGYEYKLDETNYQTADVFSGLASGTYKIVAKSADGCVSPITNVTITAQPAPPVAPTVNVVQPTCATATGTITITAPIINGYSYSIDGVNYQASEVFTNIVSGSYTIKVKTADGCTSSGTAVTINAQPVTPAKPTISSSASGAVCAGTSVTLTSSIGDQYQWYASGVAIQGATSRTYTTSLAGSFTVVVTSANGCSSTASDPEVVVVNPIPSASIAQGSNLAFTDCANTSLTLTATTDGVNPTYQWYKDGVLINGAQSSTYNATSAGVYYVAISSLGCSNNSATSTVASAPSASATGSTAVCEGNNVNLSTTHAGSQYQWQRDSGSGYQNIANATSTSYAAVLSGNYRVNVDGAVSCPITVTVNPLPTVSVTATPSTGVCAGQQITLAATTSGNPNFTYQWTISGTNIASATMNSYVTGTSGSYAVLVTDANGCTDDLSECTNSYCYCYSTYLCVIYWKYLYSFAFRSRVYLFCRWNQLSVIPIFHWIGFWHI